MNTTITPVRPACFKSIGEFANWLAATKRTGMPKSGYCTDCTPAYQREMLTAHRCGHPGVTFSIDDDGVGVPVDEGLGNLNDFPTYLDAPCKDQLFTGSSRSDAGCGERFTQSFLFHARDSITDRRFFLLRKDEFPIIGA